MKKNLLVAMAMVLVLVTGCNSTTSQEAEVVEAVNVEVEKASNESFERNLDFTGSIRFGEEIPVISKYAAKVTNIYVTTGQKVSKGEALAKLSSTDYESQFTQAEDGYAAVVDGIKDVNKQIKNVEKQEKQVKKQLNIMYKSRAEIAEQMAALPAGDMLEGLKAQLEKLDDGIAKSQEALAGLDSSKLQLKTSKKTLLQQKKSAKSGVESVNKMKSDFVLKAPISGYVGSIGLTVNSYATQQSPAFYIVSKSSLVAELALTEAELTQVKKGQKAVVIANGVRMNGRVKNVNMVPDMVTQMYTCQVKVNATAKNISSGMIAEVSIKTTDKKTLMVKKEAVLADTSNDYVFVIEGDKAKRANVKLGMENDTHYEILSGIKEGDEVVVRGQNYLEDGTAIKVVGR